MKRYYFVAIESRVSVFAIACTGGCFQYARLSGVSKCRLLRLFCELLLRNARDPSRLDFTPMDLVREMKRYYLDMVARELAAGKPVQRE